MKAKWHYLLVLLVAAAVQLPGLGRRSMEEHEAFVAITANNMVTPQAWLDAENLSAPPPPNTPLNHWMVPVMNGQPRLVKTPLQYWFVAGLQKLGLPAGAFTTRLPSALAAIALCLVMLALGRQMLPPGAALIGAIMLAGCSGLVIWGRNGRPEMNLALWMSASMLCFWRGVHAPGWRRHTWILATFACLGLANLAKEVFPLLLAWPMLAYLAWRQDASAEADLHDDQPSLARRRLIILLITAFLGLMLTFAIVTFPHLRWWTPLGLSQSRGAHVTMMLLLGGPLAWYMLGHGGWRQVLPLLPAGIVGIVIMLAMVVPWFVFIAHIFPQMGNVIDQQVGQRAAGAGKWQTDSTPAFYLLALLTLGAPWMAFWIGAFATPLMNRFRPWRNGLVFLLLWVVGLFVILGASAGKRDHYLLPLLPALCMLCGFAAWELFLEHRWLSARLSKITAGGHALVLALATVAVGMLAGLMAFKVHAAANLAEKMQMDQMHMLHMLGITAAAAILLLAAYILLQRRPRLAMGMFLLAPSVAFIIFGLGGRLWSDPGRQQVADEARRLVAQGNRVGSLGKAKGSVVYYSKLVIPDIRQRQGLMIQQLGEEKGLQAWRQWLYVQPPMYILCAPSGAGQLKDLNYVSTETTKHGNSDRTMIYAPTTMPTTVPVIRSSGSDADMEE